MGVYVGYKAIKRASDYYKVAMQFILENNKGFYLGVLLG
jgi:hypothetical protein